MKCVIAYPSIWIIQVFFLGLASIRNILKLDNPDSERERETSGTTYACLYNREIYDFDTLSDFFRIFYLCGEKLSISCDYIIKIGNDT